jgi:ribosomal protein S27AE
VGVEEGLFNNRGRSGRVLFGGALLRIRRRLHGATEIEMAMNCGTEEASADHVDYKMICEQCGSLTIALPVEAKPSPNAVLSCGRCGAPRGTLQSLRDRSNRLGLSGQGL